MNPDLLERLRELFAAQKRPMPMRANQEISMGDMIATNNAYAGVAKSPYFRDTLGVKSPVGTTLAGGNTFAYYDPRSKGIFVNVSKPVESRNSEQTPAGSRTARNVLTHEGAHALYAENPEAFPSYNAVRRPTFSTSSDAVSLRDGSPLGVVRSHQGDDPQRGRTTFDVPNRNITEQIPIMFGMGRKNVTRSMTPSEQEALRALDRYYMLGGLRGNEIATDPDESFAQAYTNAANFLSETASDTTGFRERLGRYEGNTPGAGGIVRDLLIGRPIYGKHPLKGVIR
jgi:hypothetical protein